VTRFRLPSRFTGLFGDVVIAMMWSLAPLATGLAYVYWGLYDWAALLLPLGALMTFLSLRKTEVQVADDGVAIRWLGLSRFIRYDEIGADADLAAKHVKYAERFSRLRFEAVEKSRGVLFRHRRGTTYLVCDDDDARDLVAQVQRKREAHRRVIAGSGPTIGRAGRPVDEWLSSLRSLLDQGGGYRGRAITSDELWAVLENPKCEPEDRAAAAFALRAHHGDDARPRLRGAVEACASPRLRIALDAIAEQDDVASSEALDQLTAE
jgi:hypothetical protein